MGLALPLGAPHAKKKKVLAPCVPQERPALSVSLTLNDARPSAHGPRNGPRASTAMAWCANARIGLTIATHIQSARQFSKKRKRGATFGLYLCIHRSYSFLPVQFNFLQLEFILLFAHHQKVLGTGSITDIYITSSSSSLSSLLTSFSSRHRSHSAGPSAAPAKAGRHR